MKKIFIYLIALTTLPTFAAHISERPSELNEYVALAKYQWMTNQKDPYFSLVLNEVAEDFFTVDEMKEQLKTSLRNSTLSQVKFVDNYKVEHPLMAVKLILHEYNNQSSIYFGLLELSYEPRFGYEDNYAAPLRITIPVADSKASIKTTVLTLLEQVAVKFSEDSSRSQYLVNKYMALKKIQSASQ